MDVPEHVQAQRVHAECFCTFDALFPVGARYAGVMYFGGFHHEWFTVEQERALAHGEVSALSAAEAARGVQQHQCHQCAFQNFS